VTATIGRVRRWPELVREIAIGGLAGLVGGVVVVGAGGRVLLRIVAAIDPTATGRLTSSDNRIGDVTLDGTVGFILFAGLLFGAAAGVIWVVVGSWIPGHGWRRWLASGVVAAAVASIFVVRAGERDFQILDPATVVAGMFVGLIALLGAFVAATDERLRRSLPAVDSGSVGALSGYGVIVLLGLLLSPLAVIPFFVSDSSFRPPVEIGLSLVVVGLATLAWWVLRAREGLAQPPAALVAVGRGALAVAVVLGFVRLATEFSGIERLSGF
jgi:hypothetical protein